jgi:hypothetical protein
MVGRRSAAPSFVDEPISPAGRACAFTTLGCVLVVDVVYAIAAWRAFACAKACAVRPAIGALVLMLALAVCAVGVTLAVNVRRRPIDPEGGGGWSYGLAVIFALGLLGGITRIPDLTCPEAAILSAFGYCSGVHDARIDPANWIWLKDLIAVGGIVVAAIVIPNRRMLPVTAPLAAIVWLVGMGLFLKTLLL